LFPIPTRGFSRCSDLIGRGRVGRPGCIHPTRRIRASESTGRDTHARSRAIPAGELLAFLDAGHPLRDKTLWWSLYETAARAGEVLALDVEDLDLAHRRAVVIGKGGRAELIGWETKTARLLPRHLHRRRQGPLFLTDIAPAPARQPALTDLDPGSGRARLSYRRPPRYSKPPATAGRCTNSVTPGSPTSPKPTSNSRC
jgi:integrase